MKTDSSNTVVDPPATEGKSKTKLLDEMRDVMS